MAGPGGDIGALLMSRMSAKGAPDDSSGEGAPPDAGADPLGDALGELAQALQAGDIEGAKTAFRAAFQACEMEPHDEAGETGEME